MSDISKTTVNLKNDLKKELKKIAIDEDITLSELIISMIHESLKNRNEKDSSFDSNEDNGY